MTELHTASQLKLVLADISEELIRLFPDWETDPQFSTLRNRIKYKNSWESSVLQLLDKAAYGTKADLFFHLINCDAYWSPISTVKRNLNVMARKGDEIHHTWLHGYTEQSLAPARTDYREASDEILQVTTYKWTYHTQNDKTATWSPDSWFEGERVSRKSTEATQRRY